MNEIRVNSTKFLIDGEEYNVGDVLKEKNNKNSKERHIILFGYYINHMHYEEFDEGYGFYIQTFYFSNNKWKTYKDFVSGIHLPFEYEKETDLNIIDEVRCAAIISNISL